MNCKVCGYPMYERELGELWCPFCVILKETKGLKDRITKIEETIIAYDFPLTHVVLTKGTFDGVAQIIQEMRSLEHTVKLLKQNLQKLYDDYNEHKTNRNY